jgi:nucleotide-binding universal stress UspA family protein
MTGATRQPLVVVGVDGSEQAQAALEWAADFAASTGARIQAVTALQYPIDFGYYPVVLDGVDPGADAAATLVHSVARVRDSHPGLPIKTLVVRGYPPRVLTEAARDATLLVVGCRGRGAIRETLLGSVSTSCVHHATCPVMVMRPRRSTVETAA